MIYEESIKRKRIKDPLFSSIKKYLENQLALVITEGNEEKIKVAKQRYEKLRHTDVQIEPAVTFDNGKIRSCFVSRTRGFFHSDALIEQSTFDKILEDLEFTDILEHTSESLVLGIKKGEIVSGLYLLTDTSELVLVLDNGETSIKAIYNLLGSIHWYEMTLTIPDSKDPVTKRSGSVLIRSINMTDKVIPIYYKPHVVQT